MADADHEELLKKLHAHGETFMFGFNFGEKLAASSRTAKQNIPPIAQHNESDEDEEWGGIGPSSDDGGLGSGACINLPFY